jgi:hypothetical protein
MFGFSEIEKWAATWRDRLISLGKQGAGPTPDELEKLLGAIGELGRMRDEAMATVEKRIKIDGRAEEDRPADGRGEVSTDELIPVEEAELSFRLSLSDIETDAGVDKQIPQSPWTSADGKRDPKASPASEEAEFPFLDEPKSKALAETAFAPKPGAEKVTSKSDARPPRTTAKRLREESNTIPIAIDDISMIGTISRIPPGESAPKSRAPLFWKIFALVSFAGFVVMTALYLLEINRPAPVPAPLPQTSLSPDKNALKIPTIFDKSPPSQKDTDAASAPKPEDKASSAVPKNGDVEQGDKTKSAKNNETVDAVSSDKDNNKDKGKDKTAGKDTADKGKDKHSDKNNESKSSKSSSSLSSKSNSSSGSDKSGNKEVGTLSVLAPGDGSDVFVLVDGTSKGKAPLKTSLAPGLHEVVFTAGGKRSMRMVPVKADQTKTITAAKPE